jgi:elongation factor G
LLEDESMTASTTNIRNIALAGHAGSGKTLLAEALLHRAEAIPAMGDLARGTTVCDFDPQERELGHSLDVALCHFNLGEIQVNLLDTPGSPELLGRSVAVLPAVETVGIVVNAASGVELGTRRMMEAARERGLDRIIVINRIDVAAPRLPELLEQLREAFGPECLPINLPAGGGERVVDCFFSKSGPATDFSSVEEAHRRIVEQVVEVDEPLMERYLAGEEDLPPSVLHEPFEKALREGHLVPVCFVSARTGAGIGELLKLVADLMPNPFECNPPPFVKGEGEDIEPVDVIPDHTRHALAHVFKVTIDPYAGRIAAMRVHQGRIREGAQYFLGDQRKPFRAAHLFKVQGKNLVPIPSAIPGDLCAVTKVDDLHVDAVIHDSHDEDHYHLNEPKNTAPMLGLALNPARHGDEQKLADALHRILAEDPSLRLDHVKSLNETVLYGHGELHLRVVLERMKRQSNVEVKTHAPSVPYRETITRVAEGHHRHKKQTGGAGQFGEVFLRVEPLPRGGGFEFATEVVGGAIPQQFILAVEKGVRQALETGAIAGFPMQDVRVVVHDGKTHAVDSKEVAFISAGRKAFIDAVTKAHPQVLEPIVSLSITAPASSIGSVTGDLSGLRGAIRDQSVLPGNLALIEASAPLAELRDYHQKLKSHTAGEGVYAMAFDRYEPAPPRVQNELMNAYSKRREQDVD